MVEVVEHAGGGDGIAVVAELAERCHRIRFVLFLLQFFERLNPLDVFVVDVGDLTRVEIFLLLFLNMTLVSVRLRLTIDQLLLIIINEELLVDKDLLSASVPRIGNVETFL